MSNKIICLDTNILIWGIKQEASNDQKEMIKRSIKLIENLHKNKFQIIIPSIVAAECLVRLELEERSLFLSKLGSAFLIVPFENRSSFEFARIWGELKGSQCYKDLTQLKGYSRNLLKADIKILSTALAYGCSELYTHDEDLSELAKNYMSVSQIPELEADVQSEFDF